MPPFDLTPYLKRRNIFGANQDPSTGSPLDNPLFRGVAPSVDPSNTNQGIETDESPNPYQGKNFADIYGKIMGADAGPATKQYRDFIAQNEPQESDYLPDKKTKFFGAMAGIGDALTTGRSGDATVDRILSKPYNDALLQYKLKADRYAKASDEEQKDTSNRIKTFRDILQDNRAQDNETRLNSLTDAQIKDYNSRIKTREDELGTKGWSFATRETDGHRIGTKVSPNSPNGYQILDLGKYKESTGEKDTRERSLDQFRSGITFGREKNLFDFTNPKLLERSNAEADHRAVIASTKMDRIELARQARDQANPDRQLYVKAAAYRDMIAEHPELAGSINLQNLTHTNDAVVGPLLKQYSAKYDSPGVTKPKATNEDAPPPGMAPGGKWVTSSFGRVYQEP